MKTKFLLLFIALTGVFIARADDEKIPLLKAGGDTYTNVTITSVSATDIYFIHAGGTMLERTLAPGETLRVDTGCIVGFQPSVDYDIQLVGGVKTALFGGEGLFFATLRGPGKIWLQSLPFSRLAGRIVAAAPRTGRGGREEGSILGGLGRVLDGDNS